MRTTVIIVVTALLAAIMALLLLSALNIFPRQLAVNICPVDAIKMVNGKAVIDAKKCIGCRRCVNPIRIPPRKTEPVPDSLAARSAGPQTAPPAQQPSQKPTATLKNPAAHAPSQPVAAKQVSTAYQVNPGICIGCELCVSVCPVSAIAMVDGKAVVDPKKCINCGICKNGNGADYSGCPVNAISAPE